MSEFVLTDQPLDTQALQAQLAEAGCGACTTFEGWVRDSHEGRRVVRLEYEAYAAVAIKEGNRVIAEALQRYAVTRAACVHREGSLGVGECSVWVGVSSPHRDAAFAACRYIIDEIKVRLPIWKKEHYADGDSGWVNCEHCAAHARSAG